MIMGYSIDRWIGLGEYIIILVILIIFSIIASIQLEKMTRKHKKH